MTEPGSHLQAAVEITDRLRSPGGCPWDAEQTHGSLAPFLLEEAYETLDAIETADPAGLREELGDLLFQVLIHARLAEEATVGERFGIEDVAADLVDKLVRRHPHVFADVQVTGSEQVLVNWDQLKQAEKQRQSVTEGVPLGQPALSLAAKLVSRSRKAGLAVEPPAGDGIGNRLLALVGEAVSDGVDPELALRDAARGYRQAIMDKERANGTAAG